MEGGLGVDGWPPDSQPIHLLVVGGTICQPGAISTHFCWRLMLVGVTYISWPVDKPSHLAGSWKFWHVNWPLQTLMRFRRTRTLSDHNAWMDVVINDLHLLSHVISLVVLKQMHIKRVTFCLAIAMTNREFTVYCVLGE